MKLISFSIENYRSITTARKIPLSDYSLLVGANNEGKSNILHALSLGMSLLVSWKGHVRKTSDGKKYRISPRLAFRQSGGLYDWKTDYPMRKQAKAKLSSRSNITLEFELTETEISEFKTEIKSNLNGSLPILFAFGQGDFELSIQKQGRGNATLNKKKNKIADFVSQRIRFEYIPAIRTSNSADKIISDLVARELETLDSDPEYSNALKKIEELQTPIFDELSVAIQGTVSNFLPSVKSVCLTPQRETRLRALHRGIDVMVDDGNLTALARKGDGVQSLTALALMRHASEQNGTNATTVIAIDEPESHLHPRAVHELRSVIEEMSENNQIVLSSHSPLFVNRSDLKNTIIVKANKANCATHVKQIRKALGVRFSDNLENARLVLLVEGSDDTKALKSIISARSQVLKDCMKSGAVTFDDLGGASALSQKASYYRSSVCEIQCFLDDDACGKQAVDKALDSNSVNISDVNSCVVPHLDESELEDIYDVNIYQDSFKVKFGVDPKAKTVLSKKKWSKSMESRFKDAGKPWNNQLKKRCQKLDGGICQE